jgi:putative tricarboxylic transport membrane protein
MQQVLQRAGLVTTVSVENVPGAAGTIGLARFVGSEQGHGDAVLVSGLIMLGGIVMHHSPVTLRDVRPIARLTGEYEVIVVPAASPFRTLGDVIHALKDRPEAISWGGGSAGGSDQILAGLVAAAVGVSPRRINYIAFDGGGDSLSAILGGHVSLGVNGLAELEPQIQAGAVRALAISSAQRLPGLDVPTLREQGVDVEFENWRSIAAPPGISASDRRRLESAVEAMVHSSEWRMALERYRWLDRYLSGDAFAAFVDQEEARVRTILEQLGAGQSETRSRSVGVYPVLVLAGLVITGLAAIVAARGARSEPPGHQPRGVRGSNAVWIMAVALGVNLLMAERAGFVVASTVLFWCSSRAFDDRHPVRDGVFALGVSVSAYLLFARALQLPLPAGVLGNWI